MWSSIRLPSVQVETRRDGPHNSWEEINTDAYPDVHGACCQGCCCEAGSEAANRLWEWRIASDATTPEYRRLWSHHWTCHLEGFGSWQQGFLKGEYIAKILYDQNNSPSGNDTWSALHFFAMTIARSFLNRCCLSGWSAGRAIKSSIDLKFFNQAKMNCETHPWDSSMTKDKNGYGYIRLVERQPRCSSCGS